MIERLRKKITLIILLAIMLPLIIVMTFYTFSYFNNVIRANTMFVDRFIGGPENKKEDNFNIYEIEGIYSVSINNGSIINTNENVTDEIKKIALKVSNKKSDSGIVSSYFYKIKPGMKNSNKTIILIENQSEITKINIVIGSSILLIVIGIILIYLLSKKIASLIEGVLISK